MSLFGVQIIIQDMVKLFCQLLIMLCGKCSFSTFNSRNFA